MRLSKKDVNLIFAVLSLIIISIFFIGSYLPSHKEVSYKEDQVLEMTNFYSDAVRLLDRVDDANQYAEIYAERMQRLRDISPEEVDQAIILYIIEQLSKDTNIDLKTIRPTSITPNFPSSNEDNNDNDEGSNNEEGSSNESGSTEEHGSNPSGGDITYEIEIRGEYRSVMVFMHKVQNLISILRVDNFVITYNEEARTKEKHQSFPLEARFNITFFSQEGGDLNEESNRFVN